MKIKTLVLYAIATLPTFTFAQLDAGGCGGGTIPNPLCGTGDIPALLTKVLHLLVQIGIPVLVVFIVYAGLKFVTAQGNATKLEEARKALFWTIIGGAVLLGAEIMSKVIKATVEAL
ncbi:MAG TPA: hypothetical protein VI953_03045 [Candidatus Paceibacterota bacterium]